jgi:nicotinamidase/pyrazinamidase
MTKVNLVGILVPIRSELNPYAQRALLLQNMTTLLIIDPQNDFHEGGSLAVPGSTRDSFMTAAFIEKNSTSIDSIVVTLDTHSKLHIAHGSFWQSQHDSKLRPPPFTNIRVDDIESGKWIPRDPSLIHYCKKYITSLEASGKFMHTIWPDHCLLGSTGHAVTGIIQSAINEWSDKHASKSKEVKFVLKGQNCLTEMYSALAAEVPVEDDISTHMNNELRDDLLPSPGGKGKTKQLIVCGQAKSHCVNFTLRDILGPAPPIEVANNVFLLEDCTSAVTGFEESADKFILDMKKFGVNCTTSEAFKFS